MTNEELLKNKEYSTKVIVELSTIAQHLYPQYIEEIIPFGEGEPILYFTVTSDAKIICVDNTQKPSKIKRFELNDYQQAKTWLEEATPQEFTYPEAMKTNESTEKIEDRSIIERLYENCDPYELRDADINTLEDFAEYIYSTDPKDIITYLLDEIDELTIDITETKNVSKQPSQLAAMKAKGTHSDKTVGDKPLDKDLDR